MLNYIGQLRIYSLVDLVILLFAVGANRLEFWGVILLHVGFLAYLESRHQHSYRKKLPEYFWAVLALVGLVLYGHVEGIAFLVCSYLYTLKTKKSFATYSPLMRGLQSFFLIGGIIGYTNKLTWVVLVAMLIRNLCGDLRDVVKDKGENMKTLPVVFGLSADIKYAHLVALFVTTFVWFQYTNLQTWLLVPIFLLQIFTYKLTPR